MDSPGVPAPRRRVAVVGTPRGAAAALEMLRGGGAEVVGVVAHVDRTARAPGLAPLLSRARSAGVPVLSPRAATVEAAVHWLTHLALDYVLCVGWSDHVTDELFRVARHGVIGVEPAASPEVRPRLAPDWAALRGDTLTGHVLLVLLPGVVGALRTSARPSADGPLGVDVTASSTYDALALTGHRLMQAERVDAGIAAAPGRDLAQLERGGSRPGLGLTSFDRSAADVHRWVQAMGRTGSGAFAVLRGEQVLIWDCEPAAGGSGHSLPAGTVLGADSGVVVSTYGGALRLLRVQQPGREAEPAAEWFGRRGLPPGCAFEPVDWSDLAWLRA